MGQFGVTRPELKAVARTAPIPGGRKPADQVQPAADSKWRGAVIRAITTEGEKTATGTGGGILLVEVPPGSRAAADGLLPMDVILSVTGKPVRNIPCMMAIQAVAEAAGPVALEVSRHQKVMTITLGSNTSGAVAPQTQSVGGNGPATIVIE